MSALRSNTPTVVAEHYWRERAKGALDYQAFNSAVELFLQRHPETARATARWLVARMLDDRSLRRQRRKRRPAPALTPVAAPPVSAGPQRTLAEISTVQRRYRPTPRSA